MSYHKLKTYFNEPYRESSSLKWKTTVVLSFGLFVFIFLYVFKPSPYIYKLEQQLQLLISLGFGFVTSLILFLIKFILEPIIVNDKWTLGKSILWSLLISASIGIASFFYIVILFKENIDLQYLNIYGKYFIYSILSAIIIGSIPVSMRHLITYNRKYKKTLKEAGFSDNEMAEWDDDVVFTAGNTNKEYVFSPRNIIYIYSNDNYCTVVSNENGSLIKIHIRGTLKVIDSKLKGNKNFVRCHNRYIANVKYVDKVIGNTQNMRLKLSHNNLEIPVSRSKAKQFTLK